MIVWEETGKLRGKKGNGKMWMKGKWRGLKGEEGMTKRMEYKGKNERKVECEGRADWKVGRGRDKGEIKVNEGEWKGW